MSENTWILEYFSKYFIKTFSAYVTSKHIIALSVKSQMVFSEAELCETKGRSCPGKPDCFHVCKEQKFKCGKLPEPEKEAAKISIDDYTDLAKSLTDIGRDKKCEIVFAWWDLVEGEQRKANWP